MPKQVLIATVGSFGDLHPYLAIPPLMADIEHNPEIRRRAMSTFDGTRYVVQELFLPPIEEACRIPLAEARSGEVLLGALGLLPPSPDSSATVPLTAISSSSQSTS